MDFVRPVYMENSSITDCKAKIKRKGKATFQNQTYQWVTLDQTIFHPKGGGQPSDEGTINGYTILYVHKETPNPEKKDEFEIYHCFSEDETLPFIEGEEVELKVNLDLRLLHSKLHTSGHLLAEAIQELYPFLEAFHGHHYPNQAYVKFKILDEKIMPSKETMLLHIQNKLDEWILRDYHVDILRNQNGIRSTKILHLEMPCGGTHVQHLQEIGSVQIKEISMNSKDGTVTVKYAVS